jgi:hypothetical protein
MTGTKVAVAGDTTATASTSTAFGGAPGTWTAGPVTEKPSPWLTAGGTAVIHEATCTFVFTNANTGATVPVPLTLTAGSTALQGGQGNVLLDGDQETDTNGNRLSVQASGAALTSTR